MSKKFLVSLFAAVFSILVIMSCTEKSVSKIEYGLVIHGGAGSIYKGRYTPEQEKVYIKKLNEALQKGNEILSNGGTSLDCVEAVINILEDSPLFNSGKGAVLTNIGTNELDASIMDGADLNAGAVAGVKRIKNPISLARLVMNNSPHVLLAGEGAEKFAVEQGVELVDLQYFKVDGKSNETLKKFDNKNNGSNLNKVLENESKFGTVGCAALDRHGNLAAGTSTGGISNKRWGRIGDSPIIGAGTYANNNTCAISATGHGEFFIRYSVAHDISALMEYSNLPLDEAANEVIMNKLAKIEAKGGVIGIDKNGNVTMPFNTDGMFRGYFLEGSKPVVKMYKE